MSDARLQNVVPKQLPEFIREDYQTLTDFITAYYRYLESVDARDLEDLRDIDKTVYDYIIFINDEIGFLNSPDVSQTAITNPLLFLRKSKQLFIARGTEESYEFLFRALFDKKVDISYPWDNVLKTSDGKWKQDTSLFVDVSSGNPLTAIGNKVIITGTNTHIELYIERVVYVRGSIYEFFIDKSFYGNPLIGDTLTYNNVVGTIIPTTAKFTIAYGGLNYRIGDIITNNIPLGYVTVTQLLKVTAIDIHGAITGVAPIQFGCGYSHDFSISAIKSNSTSINTKIKVDLNNVTKYSGKDLSKIDSYSEIGSLINDNVWSGVYTHPFYAGTIMGNFISDTNNLIDMTSVAIIQCHLGPVAKYQGYYTTTDGFLDDAVVLQDSKFYQKYSTLLTVDLRLQDYKTYVKGFVHPAGVALFGNYQLQNTYEPGISAKVYVEQFESKATFRTIKKTIPVHYVNPKGSGGIIRMNPYDLELYFENTYNPETRTTFIG